MDDDMSINSSDQSSSSSDDSLPSIKMEKCLLENSVINIPDEICERDDLFHSIFSMKTWNERLSSEQKSHLTKFLPTFPDGKESQRTLEQLFSGQNFKFGNPCEKFFSKLRDGYYNIEVAKIAKKLKKAQYHEYKHEQRRYYYCLFQDVLLSRKKLLEAAADLPPGVPVKMEQLQSSDKAYTTGRIEDRTKRRYFKELQEVREECHALETSSEDENYPEGPPPKLTKKQKKQLHTMEQSMSPDIHRVTSTMSTLPLAGSSETSTVSNALLRSPSMIEITDEQYREMLFKHRKHRAENQHHPVLNTSDITLEQIIDRTNSMKRNLPKSVVGTTENPEKKSKIKIKKKKKVVESSIPIPVLTDPLGLESNMTVIKAEPGDPQNEVNIMSDGEPPVLQRSVEPPVVKPEKQHTNFFCLLREKITNLTEKRATSNQILESIRQWEDSPAAKEFKWFEESKPKKWSELVISALKFLAGELLGVQPPNFIPFIDYKEKLMQWVWVGHDWDSDEEMRKVFAFWILKKDEIVLETSDSLQGTPPPPRVPTNWTVKPTTSEEKSTYQSQELLRYQNPHKAFTFRQHCYESVVGPVKGVYGKEMASTLASKAREHSLLVPNRPSCVTLLSLVRDAVARLPNGEGTRTDISQLLKDSQFIAEGTDQQLHTVVSGALDRLHYEKDPCVKYDGTRKLWIYLHRNRNELEFEKIHEAQAQAAKARKSMPKAKISRSKNKDQGKLSASSASTVASTSSTAATSQSVKTTNTQSGSGQAVVKSEDGQKNVDKESATLDKKAEANRANSLKAQKANQLAQKIIKQELSQPSIVKKVDTENITKASQRRNPPKPVAASSDPANSPAQAKLVGQPQLVQSSQAATTVATPTFTTRPTFTSVAGVPQVGRVQTRATLAARLASPQLITMQPGVNPSSRVRCSLTQGHRLPQSAVIQTVLSQTARAKLSHALSGHGGKPVLIQSSSAPNTPTCQAPNIINRTHVTQSIASPLQSAILKTSAPVANSQTLSHASRNQLSQSVMASGQQVILKTSSPSLSRPQTTSSGQTQPLLVQSTSSNTPQVTAVLTNIHHRKSPIQSTHTILSPVNVGQRPTLLTTVKPGTGHIVQRSLSMSDSNCVTPQTIQLLTSQPRIPLAGQRITTSQVNLPININKAKPTLPSSKSNSDLATDVKQDLAPLPQIAAANLQSQLQYVKVSQPPPISSVDQAVDKHQGLTSPLTLNSVQNTPSRPSSTGSAHSLPSPKALVASINAAQLVGDLSNSNASECSSPINIPQVTPKPEIVTTMSKSHKPSSQQAYVHQLLTKGHVTLPVTDKTAASGVKTTMATGITHTVLLKSETGAFTSTSTHSSPTKPVVAHIISSPQVVSMGNLLAQGPKQAIRIHGGNLVRPGQMIGQQVGVLQPCTAGGVSRLALVSPTCSVSTTQGGTTTKLVAVGPGGHLGVVDASQLASLTRGIPSQIHMSANKPVVINTQSGLKIVSGGPGVSSADQALLSQKAAGIMLSTAQAATSSDTQTVTPAKNCSQTYVMAALTGSSGVMHPVSVPTVSGLQGVKVIPVTQSGAKGHMTQPMLARIITPTISMQSNPSAAAAAPVPSSQIPGVQAPKVVDSSTAATKPTNTTHK